MSEVGVITTDDLTVAGLQQVFNDLTTQIKRLEVNNALLLAKIRLLDDEKAKSDSELAIRKDVELMCVNLINTLLAHIPAFAGLTLPCSLPLDDKQDLLSVFFSIANKMQPTELSVAAMPMQHIHITVNISGDFVMSKEEQSII